MGKEEREEGEENRPMESADTYSIRANQGRPIIIGRRRGRRSCRRPRLICILIMMMKTSQQQQQPNK